MASVDALNQRRHEAVRLRLEGRTLSEVSQATGLSAPTVITAHKRFLEGGWDAVSLRPRGRKAGEGRLLSPEQEATAFAQVASQTPDGLGLPRALWQAGAVQSLLKQHADVELPPRSVSNYLARWGLSAPRPFERLETAEGALAKWRSSVYPDIVARARSEGGSIFWVDETSLPGWAGGDAPQKKHQVVRAVTLRGKLLWLGYEGGLQVRVLIDFFDRLLDSVEGKAFVILDGMQWRRAAALSAWLSERHERLLCFHLPEPAGTADVAFAPPEPPPAAARTAPPRAVADAFSQQVAHLMSQPATAPVSPRDSKPSLRLTHLQRLEAESLNILREAAAECERPVLLYSMGKDSAVLLHLAMKAFFPAKPPFPLLHIDTTWKFRDMIAHRDRIARELGLQLLVHTNAEGLAKGVNPFTHGSSIHTDIMKTEALKQALELHRFDAAIGGARRDEEKSRAKERVFSFRSATHRWDPKDQRPELWQLYNTRKHRGESLRVFPLSNWTELDVWQYIHQQKIPLPPLYFARMRPVVERDGALIMVDDDRMPLRAGEVPVTRQVRFRTLGCYPLTGAIESQAETVEEVIGEMLNSTASERQGRVIDHDATASMEKKKQEGYF
jgi:sulfate adenylyltransferase subunit 2